MKRLALIIILSLYCISGCGRPGSSYKKTQAQIKHEGVMSDRSYAGLREGGNEKGRLNADGSNVRISEFSGKFVWVDYSAIWCEPCKFQAKIIKKLEKAYPGKAVFLTVITSKGQSYEDIPNQKTAKEWANRYKLDPKHVLVATNLWAITIPRHIFFSPEGQTIYWYTGYLKEEDIRSTLEKRMQDWKQWKQNGTKAGWMK